MNWHDIKYILECTAENLGFILPVLLLSGAAAFWVGLAVSERAKSTVIRLLPAAFAEFALLFAMLPYLVRWAGMQSLTWGFGYEGGWEFYLPFSGMIGVLSGYPLAFLKKTRGL